MPAIMERTPALDTNDLAMPNKPKHAALTPDTDIAAACAQCHPACIACRPTDAGGLGLRFVTQAEGCVVAEFPCDAHYQGYPDRLHGGIVATLLDAAMTHCLFAHGLKGVTGRLNVRFRHPVVVGKVATVRAWIERDARPLLLMAAELSQEGEIRARAEGKFQGEPLPTEGP